MKKIWILMFLCPSLAGFGQTPASPDSGQKVQQIPDSATHRFPFLVNAVMPWRNYFSGGQYLFEKWVRGSLVTANNESFAGDHYFFNYNKVTRSLFLTADFKDVVEIDNREFKSFTLFDSRDEYRFEHVFLLDRHRFYQVLLKTEKYSLYKYIATRFRKTEAVRNSGEFVDSYFYYVVFPGGRMFKEVALRKRSILRNLVSDPAKVDAYFARHEHEPVDEDFLVGLIGYLNK